MLLEFSMKNFKNFLEETNFSMLVKSKQHGLRYSILTKDVKNKPVKALCSSVIYGQNSAGKTNIIGAIEVLKAIVGRGHIKNCDFITNPNLGTAKLELLPNNTLSQAEPVEFTIKFIEDSMLISYKLKLDLGEFLDIDYNRKVLSEELEVNNKLIFSRSADQQSLIVSNLPTIMDYLPNVVPPLENLLPIMRGTLIAQELFLCNGFKLIISPQFVDLILKWFKEKMTVIYRADTLKTHFQLEGNNKKEILTNTYINDALKAFGVTANEIGFFYNEETAETQALSVLKLVKNNLSVPAELFESYGTIRLLNIFPVIMETLQRGGVLLIDEFDASIHPMALMNIVGVFHNDDININKAQLIFNTHNPIFLNSNIFRRDEIKFVERDEETHSSEIYSLSDFSTKGEGKRNTGDYMRNYFVSQYGAIKDVDFSSVVEKVVKGEAHD
ncbi:MAG: abortive phage infection protein [Epulopiscium sp. Nele67-Bin002]|nr:MAG: abortive phage infection protein [Epulopiscium sp. Nele67-Bin001]OON92622.1 MAG: abortive phage infection protein [Epulopiscium sp. Nele67-Bin002]